MGFWDKPQQAQQPQQQTEQQPAPAAWWQEDALPRPPAPQQQHPLMQQGAAPATEYVPKARLKKGAGECPECGSGNYATTGQQVSLTGGMVSVTRCYDCGFPVKNQENGQRSTQGAGGDGRQSDGHARQIAGAGGIKNNYHPEVIVDRAPGERGPRTQ